MPTSWVTCALGPYNFEFMTSVIDEIMTMYKVDGIFANRWSGSGDVLLPALRAEFQGIQRSDLPRPAAGRAGGGRGAAGRGARRRGAGGGGGAGDLKAKRKFSMRHGIGSGSSSCIHFGRPKSGRLNPELPSSPTVSTRFAKAFQCRFFSPTARIAPRASLHGRTGNSAKDARATFGMKPS